jgi:hypothetical protein
MVIIGVLPRRTQSPAEFEEVPVNSGLYYDRRYVIVHFFYCFFMHNMRCREIGANGWVPFFLVKENQATVVVAGHTVNPAKKAGRKTGRRRCFVTWLTLYTVSSFV